jgi:hypothetical protein
MVRYNTNVETRLWFTIYGPLVQVLIIMNLAKLNSHLATRSYIHGSEDKVRKKGSLDFIYEFMCRWSKSSLDASTLLRIPLEIDSTKYPHVARWRGHIGHFPSSVRASWPNVFAPELTDLTGETVLISDCTEDEDSSECVSSCL